jgi:phosphoadenosine phosphosulfate reductase
LWDRIDEVVLAVEGDKQSAGMRLAQRFGVDTAPFFVVTDEQGERVYTSALKFIKECLSERKERPADAASLSDRELDALAENYRERPPQEIVRWGLERFGKSCAIAFSGAEDVVLIDMAVKLGLPFSVFCLDTGRLHPQTYRFLEKVRSHYAIEISLLAPDAIRVEDLVRQKGLFSFYEDGHHECCNIRKVEPLKRALARYRAWVTGQRRDQSPATRSAIQVVLRDAQHQGLAGPLVKLNPLANWSLAKVWQYIRDNDVPYNELHTSGYVSIGCEPCTRPIRPGEHERAGRWWWEEETRRECGLHVERTPNDAPDPASSAET